MKITEFTDRVLPDVPGCSVYTIQTAVVEALSKFCAETWVLQRGMGYTITSVDSTLNNQARIPLDEVIDSTSRPVGVCSLLVGTTEYPVDYKTVVNHVSHIATERTKKFYNFEDTATLILYPMTTGDVYVEVAIAPLSTATEIDDMIYDYWVDTITSGAKARLLGMPDKAWTDVNASFKLHKEFKEGIVSARRQVHKSFTNKSLSVEPRSNQVWL